MSVVVLLILALVWAVFLVPQLLRSRAEQDPKDSIGAFRAQLSTLERTAPSARIRPATTLAAPPLAVASPYRVGMTLSEARKRRRDILAGLATAAVATLLLGLIPALRSLLTVHLVIDVALISYIGLLARARALAAEREMKVHVLPTSSAPEPAFALRRAVN